MGNPEQNVDATSETVQTQSVENQEKSQAQIDWEKRFKDTQGAYTKSQQELKAAKAKLEALEKLTQPKVELDEATKTELEDLKYSDPDAWRAKMNSLEQEAKRKHTEMLDEASQAAKQAAELEYRQQVLIDFQASHPDIIINDEVIKYDVPPRITKRLESGEVSFEQYLNDVAEYLKTPKVIGDGNTTLNQPNLNRVGGDDKPSDSAVKKDIVKDYKNLVF